MTWHSASSQKCRLALLRRRILRSSRVQAKFLSGSLHTVAFKVEDPQANPDGYINRAYVHGRDIDIFRNDEQLLAIVGSTHGSAFFHRLSDPASSRP